MGLRIPWFIVGFSLGALDGALLAVSICLAGGRSFWPIGIAGSIAVPLGAFYFWELSR